MRCLLICIMAIVSLGFLEAQYYDKKPVLTLEDIIEYKEWRYTEKFILDRAENCILDINVSPENFLKLKEAGFSPEFIRRIKALIERLQVEYLLPEQIWKRCRYVHNGEEIIDMTTDFWQSLPLAEQMKYAKIYQKGYAKKMRLPVERVIRANGAKFRVCFIPPGRFCFGRRRKNKYKKQNYVVIGVPFWIGKYEVTQAQWTKVMKNNPSYFPDRNSPVERISWNCCRVFCEKTNFRLPKETEWEYACRAGTTSLFNTGKTIHSAQVNYDGNYPYSSKKGEKPEIQEYRGKTVPVGSLANANSWGCYDFHGNVWEWCENWYGKYYNAKVTSDEDSIGVRVIRGGGWCSKAKSCRAFSRIWNSPEDRFSYLGFRICLTISR